MLNLDRDTERPVQDSRDEEEFSLMKLFFCAGGIYLAFLYYGYLLEKVTSFQGDGKLSLFPFDFSFSSQTAWLGAPLSFVLFSEVQSM